MAGWLAPRTPHLEVRGSSLARLQCAVTLTFTYIFTILNQILISSVISINKLCIILLFSVRGQIIPEAAERFEPWGGGGGIRRGEGLIFHSDIRTPLLKFFKMPFALFVGTSNLYSV